MVSLVAEMDVALDAGTVRFDLPDFSDVSLTPWLTSRRAGCMFTVSHVRWSDNDESRGRLPKVQGCGLDCRHRNQCSPFAGPDAGRVRCVFPKTFDRQLDRRATPPAAAGAGVRARADVWARDVVDASGRSASLLLTVRTVWRHTAGAVANVIAPSDCRACGGPLLLARRFAVCDGCLDRLGAETGAACSRCGERLAVEEAAGAGFSRASELVCEGCAAEPPRFVRASAFAAYDGTLRSLIRLHKFEGMQELAEPLGARLATVLRRVAHEAEGAPLHLVAVPLFGNRRRYNQSRQIADAAIRELHRTGEAKRFVASHGALRRVRATDSQSHLSPAQRRLNVRGAFAVCGDVKGWTAVLVDDVYTTGATAAECTRTLLGTGAAAVYVVTLARTQPERVERWGNASG